MKLSKVKVFGYKSIKEEITIIIDKRTTVFIGANDHGKTNILEAIECLNDNKNITKNDKNWDLLEGNKPRIEWSFKVNENTNTYLNKIAGNKTNTEGIEKHSDSSEKLNIENNGDNKESENENHDTPLDKKLFFEKNNDDEIIYYCEGVNQPVKILSTPILLPIMNEKDILKIRPKIEVFYKSPESGLIDEINKNQLADPNYEFIKGIFHFAGIWDDREEIFIQNDATSKKLDEASEKLTKILNDKWNQGKNLKWKLKHTGTRGDHISIEIEDSAIKNQYSRPSQRSSGFKNFFLFSMMINARILEEDKDKYIFIFDEPGIYLHPKAQLDLQRSFEAIADDTQIIYSTHSLFLINNNYPERNRVVSKPNEGTKIDQKPFRNNWKAVRDCLGILLSSNFLIAEKTLLVEGPSDVIYIRYAIKKLKAQQVIDIDLNDFSIVDAGDSKNYVALAKLMVSEGRTVVALLDGDETGKKINNHLKALCSKEIEDKLLQIQILDDNESIEDYFVEKDSIRKAILNVTKNLLENNVREQNEGVNVDDHVKNVGKQKKVSLGYQITSITKGWFKDGEELSKLSIALEYENIVTDKDISISVKGVDLIKTFKKLLALKGEKSID